MGQLTDPDESAKPGSQKGRVAGGRICVCARQGGGVCAARRRGGVCAARRRGGGGGGPLCGWGRATRLGSEPGSSLHQGAPLFCLRVLIARDELQPSLNFGDQFSPERAASTPA